MNITLLVYLEADSSEFDKSIDQIAEALRAAGHKPSIFGVRGDLSKMITGLRRRKPDLAALGEFYDRHRFGAALRRQAERLAGTVSLGRQRPV